MTPLKGDNRNRLNSPLNDTAIALAIAAFLDYLLGDPWGWPHPVQAMGWAIAVYTQNAFKQLTDPRLLRLAGIVLGIVLIFGSGLFSWLILQQSDHLHPLLGMTIEIILLASCFAGRSLRQAATDVLTPLESGDLSAARQKLSQYVGRDTENLPPSEILRAILETVTENAVDGVTAPLFFATIGAIIPGVGPVPLAIAYKAASTLDSMVGYKEPPYTDIGWFSAKLEDCLTWVPCRLTLIVLALISGKPRYVWQICQRDAPQDPSPNSGWSECAYAAILGVQLGGTNTYRGQIKHKPLLGDPLHPITPETIQRALHLTRICFLIGLGLAIGLAILLL